MKRFNSFILESAKEVLDKELFDKFKEVVEKCKFSKEYYSILYLIDKHPELLDRELFVMIEGGQKVDDIDKSVQQDIVKLSRKIGDEVKVLPAYLSELQIQAIVDKQIDATDLVLDLETEKGRDAVAKRYKALVEKIVHEYSEKSSLSKEELRGAAYVGLVLAMNDYKNPSEMEKAGKASKMNFTRYAAYRIQQKILDEMNNNSRDVKISAYYQNKLKDSGEDVNREFSIDHIGTHGDEDQAMAIDRFLGLSESPNELKGDQEKAWKEFCKKIESKFSARDCNIFYRVWGVNGEKETPVKDLAKEYGISTPAVTQACKRIIEFVRKDKSAQDILDYFNESYVGNMMMRLYDKTQEEIVEGFLTDEIYLLLESANKWNDKNKLYHAVNKATDKLSADEALYIYRLLENLVPFDIKVFKKESGAIRTFLENMYPDKSYKKASIDELQKEIDDIKLAVLKLQVSWQ